ncbi:hypothetical protein [Nannocystis pusilla]|uniref:hypothetical protein n=1 Tax=Nannocystis pusilla TaxID=889268 RepID=UPI003B823916
MLLEEMAAALEAEETRRNLQSTLGLFSDWLGEVRWKHAPVDAACMRGCSPCSTA